MPLRWVGVRVKGLGEGEGKGLVLALGWPGGTTVRPHTPRWWGGPDPCVAGPGLRIPRSKKETTAQDCTVCVSV